MRKLLTSILLSLVLIVGISFVYNPVYAAINANSDSVFEGIDYKKTIEIRVILDGEELMFDEDPTILQGRTLVPMRGIFEAFGLTVEWDEVNKIAKGTTLDSDISFTIGSKKVMVNGAEKTIDVPAQILSGRTMIPLRFVSENMGYNVVWVGNSNLILLSEQDIIEWRYDGYETVEPYKEYESKYVNGEKTAVTRYTGINHQVKFVDLYSADGRLIPNVPEFNIAHYGTGWFFESPYAGKTYWISIDKINGMYGKTNFYQPNNFASIESSLIGESAATGNYVKVKIEEHLFDLNIWKKMGVHTNSELNAALDEISLNGKIINSEDTILKVVLNDEYSGYILFNDLLAPLLEPDKGDIYTVLDKDPRVKFKWTDDTWQRLKGENPWTGMTKDMLLVQKQKTADKSTKLTTRSTVFELLVYEHERVDSVYLFDNNVLNSML
jgi:hypothetical protein